MAPAKRRWVPIAGGSTRWALPAGATAGILADTAHSPSWDADSSVLQVSAFPLSPPYCNLGCLEIPCPQTQAVTGGGCNLVSQGEMVRSHKGAEKR